MKKIFIIFNILISIILLVGCQYKSDIIVIGEGDWQSNQFYNQVAKIILEHGYDKEVELKLLDTPLLIESLKNGSVDLNFETWSNNVPTYQSDIEAGLYQVLGVNFNDNVQGIYVPRYISDVYQIKTLFDLIEHKNLFPDPEITNWNEKQHKGVIYGGPNGWDSTSFYTRKFQNHDVYGSLIEHFEFRPLESTTLLDTMIIQAFEDETPWVGFNWEPTAIMGRFEMVLLEDDYTFNSETGTGMLPSGDVTVVSKREFENEHPDVIDFLKKYQTSSDDTSSALAYMFEYSLSAEATAKWWMLENESTWSSWVDENTYQKVMVYLNSNEPSRQTGIFEFPEKLNIGEQIASGIDHIFDFIKNVFGWFFSFIRYVILTLLDLTTTLLTKTPWWIWAFALVMSVAFKKMINRKTLILSMTIYFVIWLLFHNFVFSHPSININLGDITTPWFIFVVGLFLLTKYLYNYKTAITLSLLLCLIGLFGLWSQTMDTLSIIIIAVMISLIIGIPSGIMMAKSKRAEKIMKPILDMMQTIPSFVYLIPAVMLFNIGRVPATFATIIYAVPPLIRLTYLGIINVDQEMVEAGKSFGSTRRQVLFKIQLPQALSTIATGVNQTTMMAIAMVVIASMIGAGGLGNIVLIANRNIEIGEGFVGGFAIVFLAIILDRLLQGVALKLEKNKGGN